MTPALTFIHVILAVSKFGETVNLAIEESVGDFSGVEDDEEQAKKRRRKVVFVFEDVQYEVDLITWEKAIKTMHIFDIVRLYGRVRVQTQKKEEKEAVEVEEERISYWVEDETDAEGSSSQRGELL